MHHRASKYSFALPVTKIDKDTSWVIEGIVPAAQVIVLILLLNPLENLKHGLALHLTIGQLDSLKAKFGTLALTFFLNESENVRVE